MPDGLRAAGPDPAIRGYDPHGAGIGALARARALAGIQNRHEVRLRNESDYPHLLVFGIDEVSTSP